MKKTALIILAIFAFFALPGNTMAFADYCNSIKPVAGDLPDGEDSYWSLSGITGSVNTLIVELAGFANKNTFGIYDKADPSKRIELFSGPDSSGDQSILNIRQDGRVMVDFVDTGIYFADNRFGYYLDSTHSPIGGLWYSDTDLNSDGMDHMVAYQGTGIGHKFILGFEDLRSCLSDNDYNDFVVMVESVSPIRNSLPIPTPEPATMLLLGLGSVMIRRKK